MSSDSTQAPGVRELARRLAGSPFINGAAGHCLLVVVFYSLLFTLFFSPVLFHHALLAPGDGLLYHVAFFQSRKVLWDTLLGCGFPMTADPQVMAWYPPSLILSLVPGSWNVFVLSAYVMAGCFTYGYVYTLTQSKLSALVGGIVYGMCGFMMAHLGHTAIIHSAVWLPLIIWSLEMLRRRFSRGWIMIGSLAIACCVLAGHLQIVAYSLLLSAAYAVIMGWTAPVGRRRFYLTSLSLLILGIGLTAIQLLPTAELARLSMRADYSFADFVTYSLPLTHALLLLFPAVFGGLPRYGVAQYFGEWNLTELTGYVGLLPLMLAAVGLVVFRRQPVVIFWLCVGVCAFLLALGDSTPLAWLSYRLPVIGKFRAPARHVIELAFAVSVLAGMGIAAILRRETTRRLMLIILSSSALIMLIGTLALLSNRMSQYALWKGVARPQMLPWSNPAVGTPLVIFLAAGAALLYLYKAPTSLLSRTLLLSILVLDLASFGWFYSWQDYAPRQDVLLQPASAHGYQEQLQANHQRMVSVRGTRGAVDELPPNLSRIWNIPNATNYSPLSLARTGSLLSMLPDGGIAPSWQESRDQSLNLAAVRYVYLPLSESAAESRGVSWQTDEMDIWLGSGCDHPPADAVKFNLSDHFQATKIGIVTRLACSLSVKDDQEVARVVITDVAGNIETQSLLAGRDTAEWSYDCRSIQPQMQHRRADIFSTFPAKMYDESCVGHYYLATLDLNGAKEIRSIEFQWTGRTGALTVEKVSLVNDLNHSSDPVSSLAINSNRWRLAGERGAVRIYENLQALPRVWLASEAVTLKPEEILSAIKTSRLPDGRAYDSLRMALVEERLSLPAQSADASASAQITQLTDTMMEVQTNTSTPALLVTSDTYYPGWQVFLDGAETPLDRADYALRAAQVPAGRHLVRFSFRPKSFYYGAAVSAFSLLILAALLLLPVLARRRVKRELLG